jgi:SAM-dependent methyltransferase
VTSDARAGEAAPGLRDTAFGQGYRPTPVERFGIWLSARRLHRSVDTFANKRVGDFGCGFHAQFVRSVLDRVRSVTLIDVALAPDLKAHPKVTAVEGTLPGALAVVPSGSLDVVMCISVLEHLWDPFAALVECRRTLAPNGVLLLNVPSWRGKWWLELAAFRLKVSKRSEIDDHKAYYDPRDLWPLLVRAGFLPYDLRVFTHKFGLNTFAVCRAGTGEG